MFLPKVRLAQADKIFTKRRVERKAKMAVTFIPYVDEHYWRPEEWIFLNENITLRAKDGFYIKANLFRELNVSKSSEDQSVDKGTTSS